MAQTPEGEESHSNRHNESGKQPEWRPPPLPVSDRSDGSSRPPVRVKTKGSRYIATLLGVIGLFLATSLMFYHPESDQKNGKHISALTNSILQQPAAPHQSRVSSAEQTNVTGTYESGYSYETGKGVLQDFSRAAALYRNAGQQGDPRACLSLARLYERGLGVTQSLESAIFWYRKAAEAGNLWANEERIVFLSASPEERKHQTSEKCLDNLKHIGLAFRIFGTGNQEKFPFNISTNAGGSMELCQRDGSGFERNAAVHFTVLSNELSTPKILACPADLRNCEPTSFQPPLREICAVSYQLRSGTELDEGKSGEVLARCPIHGHVVYCDGSVKRALTE